MPVRLMAIFIFVFVIAATFLKIGANQAQADPAITPGASTFLPVISRPIPTPIPTVWPVCAICSHDAYNCADFIAQGHAQACFDHCYELTGRDVHRLDRDIDMIACEWLPTYQ